MTSNLCELYQLCIINVNTKLASWMAKTFALYSVCSKCVFFNRVNISEHLLWDWFSLSRVFSVSSHPTCYIDIFSGTLKKKMGLDCLHESFDLTWIRLITTEVWWKLNSSYLVFEYFIAGWKLIKANDSNSYIWEFNNDYRI